MNDVDERAVKIATLRAAIDEGLAELDAGLGMETMPEELVREALDEIVDVVDARDRA